MNSLQRRIFSRCGKHRELIIFIQASRLKFVIGICSHKSFLLGYSTLSMIHWEKLVDCQLIICLILMLYYVYTLIMLASSRNQLVHESLCFIFIITGEHTQLHFRIIVTGIFDIILCIAHQFNRTTNRLGLGIEFDRSFQL